MFNEKHWDELVAKGIATDPDAATKDAAARERELAEQYALATAAR